MTVEKDTLRMLRGMERKYGLRIALVRAMALSESVAHALWVADNHIKPDMVRVCTSCFDYVEANKGKLNEKNAEESRSPAEG